MYTVLIVVNLVSAVPAIYDKLTFKRKVSQAKEAFSTKDGYDFVDNVYYFIFDEYGGTQGLKHYYDFDNKDFKGFLKKRGFTWSDTSYNRESIDTVDTLPNMLNLDYVTEIGGTTENNMKYTEFPVLYQIFSDMGYQINLVNHRGALGTTGCNVLTMNGGWIGYNRRVFV